MKEAQGETRPWDLLQPGSKTTDEIANQRYDICKACPEFINMTKQCKKCGCFMSLKVKLADAACPIDKWQKVEATE
jgi:hypothetical protein